MVHTIILLFRGSGLARPVAAWVLGAAYMATPGPPKKETPLLPAAAQKEWRRLISYNFALRVWGAIKLSII
ncbi:hypothetical protein FAK_35120 [Desulfoferula mesophila]|uniref:Secreted protein n=1 Tax=Desulfoferula mesophila TaxID=3058419 RepID=A0AAU9F0E7_9BACT|nr:hypothetical protein FAK_35120 [Desulfoferula mesophilus]